MKPGPLQPSYVVESKRRIEAVLMVLVIGQQHSLTYMGEAIQTPFEQLAADAVALVLRVDEDVLHVYDRDVIAQHSGEPDKPPVG